MSIALLAGVALAPVAAGQARAQAAPERRSLPPRVIQAQRFLVQRGWTQGRTGSRAGAVHAGWRRKAVRPQAQAQTPAAATWQAVGPTAVLTPNFGLVTARVSALAFDPSDTTGNRLYLGTTGGGVWVAQNAGVASVSSVAFSPLTDNVAAMSDTIDASISIGALTVQPGGTGVVLAGTGDPNDALDSYYGAGILLSTDGGNTWSLIPATVDEESGLSAQDYKFEGEGFAGFAWSTGDPQLVVAAVSQALEGTLVNAGRPKQSYEGLYYSNDAGATWHLATITDGNGADVQGPTDAFVNPDGNAATSVVWNRARQLFVAAVRYHGYYQSPDGVTWTRMAAQPGSGMTSQYCPTNSASTGSTGCPIFRGTLAVNPETGDTFAWTVDAYNQNQGLWQDQCSLSGNACANQTITFAQQWDTAALETSTIDGAATIANGDYNLALAAVPSQQDTLLLAGANDLWKCSLAMGCAWRNTTNATTCMSAQVAEYQHALAWNAASPLEIFVGNDSGLWRSTDAIGETGPVCSASDSSHFQNMNGSLGSLAEVVSISAAGMSQYTIMAGLGVNGTAGVKSSTGPEADWPQILGGDGGPVAIDPSDGSNWYVNNEEGVSIYLCSEKGPCNPAGFGTSPVVNDADVGGDGYTMTTPAPFLVDPANTADLLIGTCRVWRGPASGVGWSGANAISPILDSGATGVSCNGDALIRSMAAMALAGGGEVVYVGMYGSADGGANLPGHILSATVNPGGSPAPAWHDLTLNPVTNDTNAMNAFGLDISSIFIDPHDPTGQTVYATVTGFPDLAEEVRVVYGSTDGGAHWASLDSNLPWAPANSVVADPGSAGTVYIATDAGVFFTPKVESCAKAMSVCWLEFGAGLPGAPVVQLSASPANASAPLLTAATFGRGVWQTPLCSASGSGQTSASQSVMQLAFGSETVETAASAQQVTVTNTGTAALSVTSIALSDAEDFSETDDCASVAPGSACTVNVTFKPQAAGSLAAELAIYANVCGGQLTVSLTGTGTSTSVVTVTPTTLAFGDVTLGTTNPPQLSVGVNTPIAITSVAITPPFTIAANTCGTDFTPPGSCQVTVEFAPATRGAVSGTLTFSDQAGTQTVILTGTGQAPATGTLNPASVSFPATVKGQSSAPQPVLLTNTGDLPLTCIVVWAGAASSSAASCTPIDSTGEFAATNTCDGQLLGPGSCTIDVTFTPNALGPQTGTLWVYDALGAQQVSLSGAGVLPPALSVSPASLSFAVQQPGVASSPLPLTVSNTGGAPMDNVAFVIGGQAASSFSIATNTCPATLNNGSSCTLQVIFDPATTGGSAATLTISSSSFGVTSASVPLSGTAQVLTGLGVSPAQLTFPAVSDGQSSAAQTVTVSNTSAFTVSALTLAATSQFNLTANTCAGSLAAGSTCTVGIVFAPTATGPVTGTLTVSSVSVVNAATVTLTGTGAVPAAIQVMPPAISFAATGVGATSSQTTVTVSNPGTLDSLNNLALAVPAGFELVANTCASTLGPGSSCTAGVEFAPTAAGAQAGNLTVTSSTVTGATTVPLSGMGFDFTVAASGSNSETVAGGQTASYTLTICGVGGCSQNPFLVSQGTFTFECATLPEYALCLFNPASETVSAGAQGSLTVEISTGQASSSSRSTGPARWRLLPLTCGLVLLPLGWKRRRKALLFAVLLAILAGGVSSCASSGGGTGGCNGGGSCGSGGSDTTPTGTYSIPVTVTSTGVQHTVTLTLTVD